MQKTDVGLLIDDAAVRGALTFVLGVEALSVRQYDDLDTMLADAHGGRCGSVVVDDGVDGPELAVALRAGNVGTAVIMISSRGDEALRGRAATAGVHRVLEMPVMPDALVDAVRSALGRQ
jgi:two-component system response regulator FixJ